MINKMSKNAASSNTVIDGVIHQIMGNLQNELTAKEIIKKLPEKLHENMKELTNQIILTGNVPRPTVRREPPMKEDKMPSYRRKQTSLTSKVPLLSKQQLQFLQTSSTFHQNARNLQTPRYSSASELEPKRTVRLNLENIKVSRPIELRSQQATAKSFRSVIELESHINQLRRTFLRSLREKQRLNKSTNQQSILPKRRKVPKEFTYDYNFNLIQNVPDVKNGTVRSPLKSKSISSGKITKRVRNPELFFDDESNLEEKLERSPTGLPEKEKRVYNNSSRRQVSHFPYISMSQNSKLYENQNFLQGPQTKFESTSTEWKHLSHFVPFLKKSEEQEFDNDLIRQNEEIVFPTSLRSMNRLGQNGNITKNPKYFSKVMNQSWANKSYSNDLLDEYHQVKAVDQ